MIEQAEKKRSLLKDRNYLLLWGGQSISTLGTGVSQVAFPLLILLLTNNPALAGTAFACGQLPFVLFSLPAGALVDRWNRKYVMIFSTLGLAFCTISVSLVVFTPMPRLIQLLLFFPLSFLIGTFTVFQGIAELAIITTIVPKVQIPEALTQMEVVYSLVTMLAPLIGVFLLGINHFLPFVVDTASYLILLAALFYLNIPSAKGQQEVRPHLWLEIREGMQWVLHHALLPLLIIMAGYLELVVNAHVLLIPVIARDHGFPFGFIGIILAAGGIGHLLGAAISSRYQRSMPFGWGLIALLFLFLILWPLYGLLTTPWLLAIIITLLALVCSLCYLQAANYRLTMTPDHLQGRVGSITRLVIFGSLSVGPPILGESLRRFSVWPTIFILWFCALLLTIFALANRRLRETPILKP